MMICACHRRIVFISRINRKRLPIGSLANGSIAAIPLSEVAYLRIARSSGRISTKSSSSIAVIERVSTSAGKKVSTKELRFRMYTMPLLDRHGGRVLHLGKCKMGRSCSNGRMANDSAHQEVIVIVNVGHEDPQKVVPVPGHRIALDNLVA